jgi:hypothetical protein
MLRDFGFVTLIDLTVSLAGVLLVLPAALAVAERGQVLDRVTGFARRSAGRLPRVRRRDRVSAASGPRPDAERAATASASPRRLA